MISWRMAAAWVAALVLTTVLTWQIVGLADSQVGDRLAAVAPPVTTSSLVDTSTSTSLASTTSGLPSTSSTAASSTSTNPSTDSTAPTPTTSPTSITSTTTAESEWSLRTINSAGGAVVVRFRPGEVELQAATPAPGFAVEIDEEGPPRVRIEFASEEVEVRVEVRWENGSLDIDIDEND